MLYEDVLRPAFDDGFVLICIDLWQVSLQHT